MHRKKGFFFAFALVILTAHACKSRLEYKKSLESCVKQLVLKWKSDPTGKCSVQYQHYIKCLTSNKDKCLSLQTLHNQTVLALFKAYSSNERFYCKDGILDTMTRYNLGAYCAPNLKVMAAKCTKRYRERFARDKGKPAMCEWFYNARQCMIKALTTNCNTSMEITILKAHYAKPFNPFCEGGTDRPKRIRKGDKGFGQCTKEYYMNRRRNCSLSFHQELTKNNGKRCRAIVNEVYIHCVKQTMFYCLQETRDAKALNKSLTSLMNRRRTAYQNNLCEGAHLQTPRLTTRQCSMTYFETIQRCNTDFLDTYRRNRVDPLLCKLYSEVKQCARNTTTTMCAQLDSKMKRSIQFAYGSFNPYCKDGRDPPKTNHPQVIDHNTNNNNTPKTNDGKSHQWSVLMPIIILVGYMAVILG